MQDDTQRLYDLRVKGSNRTPEENAEYDELVQKANASNNAFQGGGENMSTQGQAQTVGVPNQQPDPNTNSGQTQDGAMQQDQQAPQQPVTPANQGQSDQPVNNNDQAGQPGNESVDEKQPQD